MIGVDEVTKTTMRAYIPRDAPLREAARDVPSGVGVAVVAVLRALPAGSFSLIFNLG